MRQNIAIALITVSLLLLGVLLGGVTMSVGMLVHEATVLIVIGNAMRLLRRSRRMPLAHRHAPGRLQRHSQPNLSSAPQPSMEEHHDHETALHSR